MEKEPILGVIGGSGLYEVDGLSEMEEKTIDTPFGAPSGPVVLGTLEGRRVAFLARHGPGHTLSPSEVNYRANIFALRMLGIRHVLSVSACGSLREDYAPGSIVIPNQLFDFTSNRQSSFFEGGLVAHVSVADPFCSDLSNRVTNAIARAGGTVHQGGAYITIDGPRFSTRAESNTFRSWGMSIIGMTTSPEAFLAREAGMCYAVMAHVTDYDVWHISEAPVTVEMVFRILTQNADLAKKAIVELASDLPEGPSCSHRHALRDALTTAAEHIPEETRKRLSLLVDPYLP